jgi:hypothetical protein
MWYGEKIGVCGFEEVFVKCGRRMYPNHWGDFISARFLPKQNRVGRATGESARVRSRENVDLAR